MVIFPHDGLAFSFPRFFARTWCWDRSRLSWKGFSNRLFTSPGMGSSMTFLATS